MRAHFFEKTGKIVMYLPDSIKFFKIDKNGKKIVEDILNGEKESEIKRKYNISSEYYKSIIDMLSEKIEIKENNEEVLEKLTINISNVCNLKCKYCYANKGCYNSKEGIMTKETAKVALDVFYKKYSTIKTIMLFGGEPTLNLEIIEFICKYIHEKKDKGDINELPVIGMVTNGTIVNDKLIELINVYDIQITVSIDGPEHVNDKLRIFRDGSISTKKVLNNIKYLKVNTEQPKTVEIAYTKVHKNEGVSVFDIIKYFTDEVGIKDIHIVPVLTNDEKLKLEDNSDFIDAIEKVLENNKNSDKKYMFTTVSNTINAINEKNINNYYCKCGINSYSVSYQGDVYPCSVLTDKDDFYFGNVHDDELFTGSKFISINSKFKNFNKFENKQCKNCYYNTLCKKSGCVNYMMTGDVHSVNNSECMFSKRVFETVVEKMFLS